MRVRAGRKSSSYSFTTYIDELRRLSDLVLQYDWLIWLADLVLQYDWLIWLADLVLQYDWLIWLADLILLHGWLICRCSLTAAWLADLPMRSDCCSI